MNRTQAVALSAALVSSCAGVWLAVGLAFALIAAGVLVGVWAIAFYDPDKAS